MASAPIILVPGFWLGGWAWEEVAATQIAAMVYVDTGPAATAIDPDFDAAEKALPSWDELGEDLDGISREQLETFRERAVPEPGGAIREGAELANEARLGIPSTVICCAFTSGQYQAAAAEGVPFLSGLAELRNVTYVDLPTSHWPMWSRPRELAAIIGDITRRASAG